MARFVFYWAPNPKIGAHALLQLMYPIQLR